MFTFQRIGIINTTSCDVRTGALGFRTPSPGSTSMAGRRLRTTGTPRLKVWGIARRGEHKKEDHLEYEDQIQVTNGLLSSVTGVDL